MAAAREPLRVLMIRHPSDGELGPYEEAIVRALRGGGDPGGYLASGEDLGIQLELFSSAPPLPHPRMLDDGRHWRQEEVRWSDEYATPAVLVDARTMVTFPAGVLPFDRVPTVRIPDGNLMRVLFLGVREDVRFLLFKRRVEEMKATGEVPNPSDLRVFCFPPSMAALLRAVRSLAAACQSNVPQLILYSDPPLRTGAYEAAEALVASVAPCARLVIPATLAATAGATP